MERVWAFFPLLLMRHVSLTILTLVMGGVIGTTVPAVSVTFVAWWWLLLLTHLAMRARDHFLEYRLIRGIDIGSMSGTMFVGHAFSIIPSAMVALTRIATMIALIGWRLEEDGNPLLVSLAIFEQTVAMLDEVVRAYILWHRKEAAWLTAVLFGVDHPGHVTLAPKSAATGWTLFAPRQHFEWHAGSEAPQTIVFGDGDEHHISLNDVGGSGGHTGLM